VPRAMHVHVRLAPYDTRAAIAALESAGLFVRELPPGKVASPGRVIVEVEAMLVDAADDGDPHGQDHVLDAVANALREADVTYENHHHGISLEGGSVNHRRCRVTLDGSPTDLQMLIGPGIDHEAQLAQLAPQLGVGASRLGVDLPDDIPPNT
jgi:hypothetical protein